MFNAETPVGAVSCSRAAAGAANAGDQRIQHRSGCAQFRELAANVTPGHCLGTVPAARLVMPTTYVGIFWESDVLVPMVSAFLDDVTPTTPDLF